MTRGPKPFRKRSTEGYHNTRLGMAVGQLFPTE